MVFKIFEFWAIFGVWIWKNHPWYHQIVLFSWTKRLKSYYFQDLKLLCSIYLSRYLYFEMCPKATLLPRKQSKWFWAQFSIPITFLKICCTAMLKPKNKRLESQFSTEENSLVISVAIFTDFTKKMAQNSKILKITKNHIS